MPKRKYINKRFNSSSRYLIQKANEIIEEYSSQGFDLTLRQLFYQFVSRDLIPNTQKEYKRLGNVVSDARLAGLIDWEAIVDRTRALRSIPHWRTPGDIIDAAAHSFRLDKWEDQRYRPEVWIEKDALAGVFERICNSYDVPYFSCRGYTSQSEMWIAAQRLIGYERRGQAPIIFHFGDHDPSGRDMTRDIVDRLNIFIGQRMEIKRVALNMDQIDKYSPPPNPAKITDTRAQAYIAQFGNDSWELDALDPKVLSDMVEDRILSIIEQSKFKRAMNKEKRYRQYLQVCSNRWHDVQTFLNKKK